MSILERLQTDLTAAMKSRDADTLSTLRMLKAALMEAKTAKPRDASLTEDEEQEVLRRYVKKRREVIEEMQKLGRDEVVARERLEIDVTMRYLPQPLGEEQVRALVKDAVAKTGATTMKDMGKVIGAVMAEAKGRADGGTVSKLVKEALTG